MARGRKDYEKAVIVVESEGYQDLHGRILMQDDFEDTPYKWTGTGLGTHFETRQQRAAYNGSFGAELDIISDAPPAERYARMTRRVPIDVTERLEFETFWRVNDLDRLSTLGFWIEFYDGAVQHRAMTRYNQPNEIWEYVNQDNAIVDITGSEQTIKDESWNELTLSIDFSTDRYIRMKSNNMEINMGETRCRSTGLPVGAYAILWITAANTTADQLIVSIDDAVLKELER